MSEVNNLLKMVLSVVMLLLNIAAVFGMIFVTNFAFKSNANPADPKQQCITVNQTQMNAIQVAVVLFWLSLILSFMQNVLHVSPFKSMM